MTQNGSYPSQGKYDANNPPVSFRVSKEERKQLEEMASREGMTAGQYVRDFLKGIVEERETEAKIRKDGFDNGRNEGLKEGRKDGFDDGRKEGFKEGYKNGMNDWQIWYPCSYCNDSVYIRPMDEAHDVILKFFLTLGWGHKSCTDKKGTRNYLNPKRLQTFLLVAEQTTSSKPDGKNE